jgi:hypothetical protein
MSISSVGSSTSYDATQMASSLVSSLDSSKDGSVDKTEFVKGLTAAGVSSDDASAEFDKLDTAKTGKLTQSNLESALSNSSQTTTTSSTTTSISSAAMDKLASESSSSTESSSSSSSTSSASAAATTSSSSETYEKADTNEDGTVTTQEQMLYDRKHAEASASGRARPPMPPQAFGTMVDETA